MQRPAPFLPAFAMACAGVALFSAMDVVMKGLSIALGVYSAMLLRAVVGSAIGFTLMRMTRTPWPRGAMLRRHLVRGVVVTVMAVLFFTGLARLPIAETIALSFIAPLIALYLASLLLGERIGRTAVVASVFGLVGVGVILSARLAGTYDGRALVGAVAVLVSAALFAWNLILQRQLAVSGANAIELGFFHIVVQLVLLLPFAPWWLAQVPVERRMDAGAAGVLVLLSSFALGWAYARAEAQRLIPVEYTAFLWAAVFGWLAFGEALTLETLVGVALIVAGCWIAARRRPELAHVEAEAA